MKIISTPKAPAAIGPYSQAIDLGDFVYMSGQVPLDPETMEMVEEDITIQTEQVFRNIKAVLGEVNLTMKNVVKTTVYLKDMNDFVAMNKVYEESFADHKPARSTVEVSRLPKDSLVEIECIASRK